MCFSTGSIALVPRAIILSKEEERQAVAGSEPILGSGSSSTPTPSKQATAARSTSETHGHTPAKSSSKVLQSEYR